MRDQIHEQLARLRLRGIDAVLDAELDRAEAEGSPPSEVIWRLLAAQEAHRREKSLAYRLTQAKLPWRWTLDSFPLFRRGLPQRARRPLLQRTAAARRTLCFARRSLDTETARSTRPLPAHV